MGIASLRVALEAQYECLGHRQQGEWDLLAGARRRRQTVRTAPADNATAQSRRHLPCRTVMKCLVPETKFAVRTAYGRAVDTGGAAALTGSRGSVSVS